MKCYAVWTTVAWLCGSSFAFAIPKLTGLSNATVVVPNVNLTAEGGGGSGLLNTPLRLQIVYDASQLPVEVIHITELRMRPSSVYGNAFTSTIPNLQINLSTTSIEPNSLSGTFAQNVGTNDTVVFQGPLTVSSRFVSSANGPKEFDIIIPLTSPFLYDPSRGNLLIDFRNASGSSASLVDTGQHADDGASRAYALSVDATAASGADVGAEVIQIVYNLQGVFAPSIVGQPQSRGVFAGETVSLGVQAVGSTPLEYQWLKQGTAIAEATNAALTLANVQLANAGSYSVVVSNAYGAVTSQTAALTVSDSSPLVVPNVNGTVDGGAGSRLLNWPLRHQVVYDNSLFPVDVMRIMELRLRPSGRSGNAFAATIPDLQINLSTTRVEPNQLNGVFAENVGMNDTVVFQGPLTVSSRFVGPELGPKEFDIIIPFTTPFLYDSSRGNLLIDFRNAWGSSANCLVDTGQRTDDGASRQFAVPANAIGATHVDNGAEVFQIVYTGVAPSIVGQPQNRNVFAGETASLSVQVVGTGALKYQWLKEGSAIPEATNAVLAVANVQLAEAGNYSVVVSNAYGVVTSQSAALTLSENSALVVPNASRMVDGDSGSGLLNTKLRHQVVYDDSLFPFEIMKITELRLRPSARFGSAFTATISNLQINLSTTSIEPNSLSGTFAQNVGTNDTVVFQGPLMVSSRFVGPVNGPKEFDIIIPLMTPFVYDPTRGNLLIDFRNASGSSASLVDIGRRSDDGASRAFATSVDATSSTEADAGAEVFQLVYTMHGGLPPSIIGEPQSRNVFAGETASLSVQVVGTPPLKYQWLKEGTPIAVGTNTVLTFANVQPSDAGSYSVVVSNAYGVVTSQSAALTLSESSVLVVPNVSRTVDDGGGSGLLNTPLRQQTVYDDSLFPDEIMRITELRMRPSARFGHPFTATISNVQINLSTTSVEPDQLSPTLLAQNVGADEVVVFQGSLTVSSRFVGPANGPKEFDIIIPLTTPFLYDRSRGNLLIDFRNASGSSASFVDTGQRSDDGASRVFATSVAATSSTGADSAADVFQIVYTPQTEVPPLIFAQPPSRSTFLGETVTFTVGVLGSLPLNYQWGRDGVPIPDATNAILVLTNANLSQSGNYSVVVSNAFGVVTSQTATLMVSEGPVLVVPTVNRTIDGGSGSGLLNTPLRQQTVYDDSLFPDEIMRITELRMRPSARFGHAFTATISNLQINLSTTSIEPNSLRGTFAQNVGLDEVVVFQGPLTVSSQFIGPANGPKEFDIIIPLTTPFLYDPSRGNLLIDFRNASGSSASLVDRGNRSDDGASRVSGGVDATSASGGDSTAEVFQIVYTPQTEVPPLIFAQPLSRSTFLEETVTFTVGVLGSLPLNYQWGRDGVPIPDATNAILVLTNANLSQAGNYSVVVSNAFGTATSQTATLMVSEGPVLVVPTVNRTIDGGRGSGLLNRQLRHQIVYDDSLFPEEFMRITELRLRPSARFGNAFTATISNLQINLSTTSIEPDHLNGTFAQNVGTNDTVVFQGPLTVSSRFVGPANGPKEFDIIIPLMTPFLYDPSRGNLLIDFRNASGSSAGFVDLGQRADDGTSRLFATSVNATSYTGADSGAEVFQIVYTPPVFAPSIVGQPHSRSVFAGETASLSVEAVGTAPLKYRWLKGDTIIAGGTNAVLTFANVQPSDAGNYSVVVSNIYGAATSQAATLTVSPAVPEGHYDLSHDFSLASNPNGVWSYGRQDGIGGAFTLLGTMRTNFANLPILLWAIFPSSRPRILHNDTTETLIMAEGTYPPETTWFAPAVQGGPGNYAVARFTVPAGGDGTYQLMTTALPAFNASVQLDTDFHVARNKVEIFSAQLNGTQIARYTDTLALVAGDTIDFAVGRGADNSYIGSELKVDAMLTKLFSNLQVSITTVSENGRTLALTFNGPLGNYAIEASTNLIDWVILTNIVDVPGQVRVTDPAINSLRQRFYRARLAP